jgi:hypothetical protein
MRQYVGQRWLYRLVRPSSLFLSRHQRRISFHPLAGPSTGPVRPSRWYVAIGSVTRCAEGCSDKVLAVVGDKHRTVPIWKSPQKLVLCDVFDVCAGFRVGNGADVAVWTRRRDFAWRRQRGIASGDGDRGRYRDTAEHERTHRPNEKKIQAASHG